MIDEGGNRRLGIINDCRRQRALTAIDGWQVADKAAD